MEPIVDRLGAARALRWFVVNVSRLESANKKWGPLRTNLVCAVASLLNSCAYCTHAHAYAFELFYFQQRGTLFPLDEHQIVRLRDGDDAEVRSTLERSLREVGLEDEIATLDTLWRLKLEGAEPANDDEVRMQGLLGMFDTLNACAIDSRVPFDEAHDPINKDTALKLRYAEARFAARRLSQVAPA
jgi:hypothetical protein